MSGMPYWPSQNGQLRAKDPKWAKNRSQKGGRTVQQKEREKRIPVTLPKLKFLEDK